MLFSTDKNSLFVGALVMNLLNMILKQQITILVKKRMNYLDISNLYRIFAHE